MGPDLVHFITRYLDLAPDEIEFIASLQIIRRFPKGASLLRAGEIADSCFLVFEGCLRCYSLADGDERILEFFTENQIAIPLSYHTGKPSTVHLDCLEDSVLCVGRKETTEKLLERIPRLEGIGHILNGQKVIENQIQLEALRILSPEERYLKLITERPDLCRRLPQYHLASYLGIKPETLSRIRKRLSAARG